MARSTSEIKQTIVDAKNAEAGLADITSNSQTSIWGLWAFVVAQAINFLEQLFDIHKTEVESLAAKSAAGQASWIRQRVLEFQYDATNPQIAQIVNNEVAYPTIDETLRIISRCSVKTTAVGQADVKVATSEPPTQLDASQEQAVAGFLATIGIAGVTLNVVNKVSDKLYVEGDVYYDGQYNLSIQTLVETAINTYLQNLSSSENFDGIVRVSDIENIIKDTTGVKDVKLKTIKARQATTIFSSASTIFDLATGVNVREWPTVAGYIVEETTSGETFADSITYIAA